MVMMPVNGITAIMINATASIRGRPTMNIAIAAASRTENNDEIRGHGQRIIRA